MRSMHTPNILTALIYNSMDSWLARRPVIAPAWNGPEEHIKQQIRSAFRAQAKIGWDQFFRGHIAKKAWRIPIGTYYKTSDSLLHPLPNLVQQRLTYADTNTFPHHHWPTGT
jgi:hypothetical protein